MKEIIKYNIQIYLRYFIGICIIAILINHFHNKGYLLPVLNQFNISILFPSFMLIIIHLLCLFTMWKSIIVCIGHIRPGNAILFHSFFGGRALGFITPGQTGELLKGMFFTDGARLRGTSLSMIYSGYNMLIRTILGLIASIYLLFITPRLFNLNLKLFFIFITIFLFGIIMVLIIKKTNIKAYMRPYFPLDIISLIRLFVNQLQNNSIKQSVFLILMSLCANLSAALAFMIILYG